MLDLIEATATWGLVGVCLLGLIGICLNRGANQAEPIAKKIKRKTNGQTLQQQIADLTNQLREPGRPTGLEAQIAQLRLQVAKMREKKAEEPSTSPGIRWFSWFRSAPVVPAKVQEQGFVYILINPCIPGLVKIGHSTRSPDERAKEISQATGVPTPFAVAWY